jgi:hypothetical protein
MAGDMAPGAEHLPSKHKVLTWNTSTTQKNKKSHQLMNECDMWYNHNEILIGHKNNEILIHTTVGDPWKHNANGKVSHKDHTGYSIYMKCPE